MNMMLHIKFEYRDDLSYPEWKEQECIVRSLKECKEIYAASRNLCNHIAFCILFWIWHKSEPLAGRHL